jgi:hypothetical protein
MKKFLLSLVGIILCAISAQAVKVDDLVGEKMSGFQIMYGDQNCGFAILWNNPITIEKVSDTQFNIRGAIKGKHICPVTLNSDNTVSIPEYTQVEPIDTTDVSYYIVGLTDDYVWDSNISNSVGGVGAWQAVLSGSPVTGTITEGTGMMKGAHIITFSGVGMINPNTAAMDSFSKVEIVVYPTNATVSEMSLDGFKDIPPYRIWAIFDEDNNLGLVNLGQWMTGYNNNCTPSVRAQTTANNIIMSKVLTDSVDFGTNSPLPMFTIGQDSIYTMSNTTYYMNTDKVKTYSFITDPMGGDKCPLSYKSVINLDYGNGFATNGGTCKTVRPLQLDIPIYGVTEPQYVAEDGFTLEYTRINSVITFEDKYKPIHLNSEISSCEIEPVDLKTTNKLRVNCYFEVYGKAMDYIKSINLRLLTGKYTDASQLTDEMIANALVLDTITAYGYVYTGDSVPDYIPLCAFPKFTPQIDLPIGETFDQDYTVFIQYNFLADIKPVYCNLATANVKLTVTSEPEIANDEKLSICDEGIEVKSNSDIVVKIYDVMGREIKTGRTNTIIPLPTQGIYIVKCGALHQKVMR